MDNCKRRVLGLEAVLVGVEEVESESGVLNRTSTANTLAATRACYARYIAACGVYLASVVDTGAGPSKNEQGWLWVTCILGTHPSSLRSWRFPMIAGHGAIGREAAVGGFISNRYDAHFSLHPCLHSHTHHSVRVIPRRWRQWAGPAVQGFVLSVRHLPLERT